MKRTGFSRFIVGIGLLLVTAPTAAEDFNVHGFRWQGRLAEGGLIEVTNLYGDIRVRTTRDDRVQLLATIQKIGLRQDDVEVVVDERNDGLHIKVFHPSEQIETQPGYKGRVDVSLLVPSSAALEARTSFGLLEARNLAGPLTARTETGDVEVLSTGDIRVTTRDGNIAAWLRPGTRSGPVLLESISGAISLEIPRSMSVDLVTATSGEITLDVPDEMADRVAEEAGRTSVTTGDAGIEIRVTSRTGAIGGEGKEARGDTAVSTPEVGRKELADLPIQEWKPGDPIRDVPRQPQPTKTQPPHGGGPHAP
jgi:hypothetical protein